MLWKIKTKIITILLSLILIFSVNQAFWWWLVEHIYVSYNKDIIELDWTYFYKDYKIKTIEFEYFSDANYEWDPIVSLKHWDAPILTQDLNKDKIIFDNINYPIRANSKQNIIVEFSNPINWYFKLKNIELVSQRTWNKIDVRYKDKLYTTINLSDLSYEKNAKAWDKNIVAVDFEIYSDKHNSKPILNNIQLSNALDNNDFNNEIVSEISLWKKDWADEVLVSRLSWNINNWNAYFSNIDSKMTNNYWRYIITLSFNEKIQKSSIQLKLSSISIHKNSEEDIAYDHFTNNSSINSTYLLSNRKIIINSNNKIEEKQCNVDWSLPSSCPTDYFGSSYSQYKCEETDKWDDIYNKWTLRSYVQSSKNNYNNDDFITFKYIDYCEDNWDLLEFRCNWNNWLWYWNRRCKYWCKNWACIKDDINPPKITSVSWWEMKKDWKSFDVTIDKQSDDYWFWTSNGNIDSATNINKNSISLPFDFIFWKDYKTKENHTLTIWICHKSVHWFDINKCTNVLTNKYDVEYEIPELSVQLVNSWYLTDEKFVTPWEDNIVALDFEVHNSYNFPVSFHWFTLSSIDESGSYSEAILSAKLLIKDWSNEEVIIDRILFINGDWQSNFNTEIIKKIPSKESRRFIFTVYISSIAKDSKIKLKISDLNIRPIVDSGSKYFNAKLDVNNLISNRKIIIEEPKITSNPPKITKVSWWKMKWKNESIIVNFDKQSSSYYLWTTDAITDSVTNISKNKIELPFNTVFWRNFKNKKYHNIMIWICEKWKLWSRKNNCINILKHKYKVNYWSEEGEQITTPTAWYEDEVITTERKSNFKDKWLDTLEWKSANYLFDEWIIWWYSNGTFRWDKLVNRAEASKFLVLAKFGKYFNTSYYTGELNYQTKLLDVKQDEWYAPFVNKAEFHNIIKWYSDLSFKPTEWVRRWEFLKMLTKTFNLDENLSYNFTDINQDWIKQYAWIVDKYNLFPDIWTKFKPGDYMTRDEVAIAIYQIKNNFK